MIVTLFISAAAGVAAYFIFLGLTMKIALFVFVGTRILVGLAVGVLVILAHLISGR